MVKTRSQKKTLKARRVLYRKHGKSSTCKKLRGRTCNKTQGCKVAIGPKKSFCRRKTNKKY